MVRCLFPLLVWLSVAGACLAMGPSGPACGEATPCVIGDRSYHLRLPDNWDGTTPLPVMLHFHGWQRTGAVPIRHQRISGATRRRGVLLIAPNGKRRTWDFRNSASDDVRFAADVLADVARRYRVDADRVFVSGYSFGSAMAWRYVCENGNEVAALLAVSGTLRQDETCPQAPREVRHVHGTADTVMDFPAGPGGDPTFPVALWRDRFGCADAVAQGAWNARAFLTFQRTTWACDTGRVSLDLHPGGHFIPHGWFARQLDQLLDLPLSYP